MQTMRRETAIERRQRLTTDVYAVDRRVLAGRWAVGRAGGRLAGG